MSGQASVLVYVGPAKAAEQVRFVMDAFSVRYEVSVRVASAGNELRPLPDEIVVSYGDAPIPSDRPCVNIRAADSFWSAYGAPRSLPVSPTPRYDGLPILYPARLCVEEQWVRRAEGSTLLVSYIDVIAGIFVLLSRYEELFPNLTDEHGRYRPEESIAFRERALENPIADEYMELLAEWIGAVSGHRPVVRAVWREFPLTVCLTHDIDSYRKYSLYPPIRGVLARILRGRLVAGLQMAGQYFRSLLGHDPHDPLRLLDIAQHHGCAQTFFVMATERSGVDCAPLPSGRQAQRLLRRLRTDEIEVGIHSGYQTTGDARQITRQVRILKASWGGPVQGTRQHYLRWDPARSWAAREEAGLTYDSSLGYASLPGFRCGTCFPYRTFDHVNRRALSLWEIPLVVMDTTLFAYLGLDDKQAFETIMNLADEVSRVHGVLTLLWHNATLDNVARPNGELLLDRVLGQLSERGANFIAVGNVVGRLSSFDV